MAILRKDRPGWESYYENGFDPNYVDKNGLSPLYYSIEQEYIEFLEYLLDRGANLIQFSNLYPSLEYYLITHRKESVFLFLMKKNRLQFNPTRIEKQIDLTDSLDSLEYFRRMSEAEYKSNLLHQAVINGTDAMVEVLLQQGFDPNSLDPSGTVTPLLRGVDRGYLSKIRILLKYKADPNKMAARQKIFRDLNPKDTKNREIYDLLIQHGLNLDDENMTLVNHSVRAGDIYLLEYLIQHKVPIDPKLLNRKQPILLHAFVMGKSCDTIVPILIQKGYDTKEIYPNGNNPLHYAVQFCNANTIQLLMDKGIDPKRENHAGYSPLDYVKDNPDLLTMLQRRIKTTHAK